MRVREAELEAEISSLLTQLASTDVVAPRSRKNRALAPPESIQLDPAKAIEQLDAGLRKFSPVLCAPTTVLMPEQEEDWTCGHMNLAGLLRCFREPRESCVEEAVVLLRAAWAEGFDPNRPYGAREDGWIGALDMLSVLLHSRLDACLLQVVGDVASQRDDASAQRGSGLAVHTAAIACLHSGLTSAPLLLQHASHSRTILGVTRSPPRLVLRDPEDANGIVRCVPAEELDGQQYQIVLVRDHGPRGCWLDDAQALARRALKQVASWSGRRAGWVYHDAAWPLDLNQIDP